MKIAFLTNILTPYRVSFFDILYEQLGACHLRVFVMAESLPLRPWRYADLKREYTELLTGIKIMIRGNDYLFSCNVNEAISEFAPDVLIIAGSWTYPTTWEVMLSRKVRKKTQTYFWTESHYHTGLSGSTKTNPLVRRIKQNLMNRFDGFCLPGKYALEAVSELADVSRKAIIRLPNLVDNHYYNTANSMRKRKQELRDAKGITADQFVFFTPARLINLKGQIPFFHHAADAVIGRPVIFVLAGDGPDKEEIEKTGNNHGLDLRILAHQNQEQVREWLALADAFLLPSLSDSNPLSAIEAAWAGLPLCISCYVGNGPELVDDGANGVVFDTLNKADVCEKITFVLNQNKEWRERAGKISHRKAEEGFEANKETRIFLKALKNAAVHASSAAPLPGEK